MPERTTGLYRAVTFPAFYSAVQRAMGDRNVRQTVVREYLRPQPGTRLLDVGCGPGSMVPYLDGTDYLGIDLNPRHVSDAQARFPGCRFIVGTAADLAAVSGRRFDRILAVGLLHHLSDEDAVALMRQAADLLDPDGHMVTVDPLHVPDGHPVARFVISRDSGRNIRTEIAYKALAREAFGTVEGDHRTDLARIPYDHWIMRLSAPVRAADPVGPDAMQ